TIGAERRLWTKRSVDPRTTESPLQELEVEPAPVHRVDGRRREVSGVVQMLVDEGEVAALVEFERCRVVHVTERRRIETSVHIPSNARVIGTPIGGIQRVGLQRERVQRA